MCYRAWQGTRCEEQRCGPHGTMIPDGSCRADPGWYPLIKGGICDRVGRLCRPQVRCIADKTEDDTCNQRATGCSNVGRCMCAPHWIGAGCNERLIPTGEQNRKNYVVGSKERPGDTNLDDFDMKVRFSCTTLACSLPYLFLLDRAV